MMPALPLTAQSRAPEMASLRRSRTLPTDAHCAKFLYTILKQLDHKTIDWQKVADDLGISNGHAARMRFSRFKTQMEGSQALIRRTKPPAKHPRSTVKKDKGVKEESKGGKPIVKEDKGADTEEDQKVKIAIKMEDEDPTDSMEDIEFATDGSESVKMEPNEAVEQYSRDLLQIKPEPLDDLILLDQDPAQLRSIPLVIKSEPFVKEEVEYGGPAFGQ